MAGRYEISDNGWTLIENIVSPPKTTGVPCRDDRQVLNGIFWILCSGAKWRDLPERYRTWSRCMTDYVSGVMMAPSTPC